MKFLILTAADHASVEPTTGKLNILGAFSRIWAKSFPVRHRAMTLVVKVGGEFDDPSNPHKFKIAFTDEDGKELVTYTGQFSMPSVSAGVQPEWNAVMEFRDFVFKKAGTYTFFIEIDDDFKSRTDVIVALLPDKT